MSRLSLPTIVTSYLRRFQVSRRKHYRGKRIATKGRQVVSIEKRYKTERHIIGNNHLSLVCSAGNYVNSRRHDLSQLNLLDRRVPGHLLLWTLLALIHVKSTPAFSWRVHRRSVARNFSVVLVPVFVDVDVDVDAFLLACLYGSMLNRESSVHHYFSRQNKYRS